MSDERFRNAVEAALFAAGRPLSVDDILAVFIDSDWRPERKDVAAVLAETVELWTQRALELVEVAGGWRFQVRREYSAHLGRLWSEKPPRYSRALMETLAIVAYRQPVTRGEIEEVRGVAVSPSILKTLQERDWIRVLGHKEIPGRPELLGTTRQFLDDFSLASLEGLPPLTEIRDLDSLPDDLFPETRQGGVPAVGPESVEPLPGDGGQAVAALDGQVAPDELGVVVDDTEVVAAGHAGEEPNGPDASTAADVADTETGPVEVATDPARTGNGVADTDMLDAGTAADVADAGTGEDTPARPEAGDRVMGADAGEVSSAGPEADGRPADDAAEPGQEPVPADDTVTGEDGTAAAPDGGDDDPSRQTPG